MTTGIKPISLNIRTEKYVLGLVEQAGLQKKLMLGNTQNWQKVRKSDGN